MLASSASARETSVRSAATSVGSLRAVLSATSAERAADSGNFAGAAATQSQSQQSNSQLLYACLALLNADRHEPRIVWSVACKSSTCLETPGRNPKGGVRHGSVPRLREFPQAASCFQSSPTSFSASSSLFVINSCLCWLDFSMCARRNSRAAAACCSACWSRYPEINA